VAAAGPDTEADSLQWPVPEGQLWRGYGRVRRGKFRRWHRGIDIGAAERTLFRAARGGLVIYADNGVKGYGNLMVVVHPDATVAFYSHARALYLFAGQKVRRGQVLGAVKDVWGKLLQTAHASADGAILFLVSSLAINNGDPLLSIGA